MAAKRVAILQSNYIPWKGYFDIIRKSDVFIFHDDLQYTKGDWRNRNKIKTPKGTEWLTIPCGTDEKRLICEVMLNNHNWQKEHWQKIKLWYQKAPHFEAYRPFFEEFYLGHNWTSLSDFNQKLITAVSHDIFGFTTQFEDSRKYQLTEKKAARVAELLTKAGATNYLSGPAAKDYLTEEYLAGFNIELEWMSYNSYPEYPQLYPPFEHAVTILDLIFNTGNDALHYF